MASVQAPALSMLETHLLLAASGHENFLIKLLDWRLLDGLCSNIAAFCSSSSISRTVHRVPSELAQTANRASDILQHFFVPAQKDNENGRQVAQVVVIPLLEVYPRHLQAAVKAVLRDKRFELEGQTFMIPKDFLLIGVSADWEGIAPYMVSFNFIIVHLGWV